MFAQDTGGMGFADLKIVEGVLKWIESEIPGNTSGSLVFRFFFYQGKIPFCGRFVVRSLFSVLRSLLWNLVSLFFLDFFFEYFENFFELF